MQKDENDLVVRTKYFALQIIRFFPEPPRTTEAQILGNNCDAQARLSEPTIASGASRSLSQNAATPCASLKRAPIGCNCWAKLESFRLKRSQKSETNVTN